MKIESKRIFLDHNSTTNLLPDVAKEVKKLISSNQPMNSSSTHFFGQQARAMVENARANVLEALGASCCYDAIFTSCGTESNNQVIQSFVNFGIPIACSNVEHASVLDFAKRGLIKSIPVGYSLSDLGNLSDLSSLSLGNISATNNNAKSHDYTNNANQISHNNQSNTPDKDGLDDLRAFINSIGDDVKDVKHVKDAEDVNKDAESATDYANTNDTQVNADNNFGNKAGLSEVYNLGKPVRFVLSLCHANNETGIVQNVKKIAKIVHDNGGILHCDCSQSFGKIPLNLKDSGIDIATVSSHKIGGLMGASAVVFANSLTLKKGGLPINALIFGGGQERGLRSGTLNSLAIFSFGLAAQIASQNINKYISHTAALSKRIIDFVQKNGGIIVNRVADKSLYANNANIKNASAGLCSDLYSGSGLGFEAGKSYKVSEEYGDNNSHNNSHGEEYDADKIVRLPNTLSIFMPNVSKMSQIMQFDLAGIAISAGSACSSGKVDRSYVLSAMGLPDEIADNTIRVTCGLLNAEDEIDTFNQKWLSIANKKR